MRPLPTQTIPGFCGRWSPARLVRGEAWCQSMFSPWLIVSPLLCPPGRGRELKERLQLRPPPLPEDRECQKPALGRGTAHKWHFPVMENVAFPPALIPSFPFSLVSHVPVQSVAELCCHTLSPQRMGPGHHISSCCEVFQPSPGETRDVIKSQRWCEDTVLTAG